MSIVVSDNGTMLYTGNLTTNVVLDQPIPRPLIQLGKLVKIASRWPSARNGASIAGNIRVL